MRGSKSAIALLLTIMFVIVITVAIGFGLKQVNLATSAVKTEKFMYQSGILIQDVLKILNENKELKAIVDKKSTSDMFLFLSQAAFIPFNSSGMEIILSIKSARSKFNLNNLNKGTIDAMRGYVGNYGVDSNYVDILLDSKGAIKVDNSYNSAIFDENPYLFRDYVSSFKHLKKINDFYTKEYNDNSLKKINFKNLFYFTKELKTNIDVNYATTDVWQMILGSDKQRAKEIRLGAGAYKTVADLNLNSYEREKLLRFKTSFFEPFLFVKIEIRQNNIRAQISFEYDIKKKKGSNFVYEI